MSPTYFGSNLHLRLTRRHLRPRLFSELALDCFSKPSGWGPSQPSSRPFLRSHSERKKRRRRMEEKMRKGRWAEEEVGEGGEQGTGKRNGKKCGASGHERRMKMSGGDGLLLHHCLLPNRSLGCRGTGVACYGGGTAVACSGGDGARTKTMLTRRRSESLESHGRPCRLNPSLDLSLGWRFAPLG